jgi:hypothetical protein
MRNRTSGGENLYDAEKDIVHNEQRLAVICFLTAQDASDIDSMRIDHAAVKIRQLWKYSSDIRGGLSADYTSNSIPRFLAKMNVKTTNFAREAYWNYNLAKAVRDGQ